MTKKAENSVKIFEIKNGIIKKIPDTKRIKKGFVMASLASFIIAVFSLSFI